MSSNSKNIKGKGKGQSVIINKSQGEKDDMYNVDMQRRVSNEKDKNDYTCLINRGDDKWKSKMNRKGTGASDRPKGSPIISSIQGNFTCIGMLFVLKDT